jgi:hypothetical protein
MPVDGDFLRHACARPQASDGCLNVDDGGGVWKWECGSVDVFDAGRTAGHCTALRYPRFQYRHAASLSALPNNVAVLHRVPGSPASMLRGSGL